MLCDLLQLSPLQRALVPSSAMSVSAIAVTQATDALPSSVSSVIPISTMCDLTLQCIQFPALLSLLPLFASCLPRLKSLTLGQTHIQHLYQLEAIAVLPTTLEVLVLQVCGFH